jgi:hypothetical protein
VIVVVVALTVGVADLAGVVVGAARARLVLAPPCPAA